MKFLLPACFLLLSSCALYSQNLSILLVDDSKDNFNNTDSISRALTNGGFAFDFYNAPDSAAGPAVEVLQNYDLVIWHTSNDGVGLNFWNRIDETNGDLAQYLTEGGNLWLIGVDFLYDRYDTAADTFAPGDFVYDYLGIAQYDAQAFGDDGGLGVPLVRPVPNQPINGLDNIDWIFSTLWWADALTIREEAVAIYEMGDDDYVLAGQTTGLWYDNGTSIALTFAFDLALASSPEIVENTVSTVINFFGAVLTDNEELVEATPALQVYPNPVHESTRLSLELTQPAVVQIDILNPHGQVIRHFVAPVNLPAGTHHYDWTPEVGLPGGVYQIRLQIDRELISKPVMVVR